MGVSGNLILLGNMNVLLAFSLNYGYKARKMMLLIKYDYPPFYSELPTIISNNIFIYFHICR